MREMNTTPEEAVAHFRDLHNAGEITMRERDLALKRWAKFGRPWIVRGEWKLVWTDEAYGCDCGKGVYCPAVKSLPWKKK